MDYTAIVNLAVQVIQSALPIGIIFTLAERLVNMFIGFAFPKTFRGGI